MHDYEGRGLAAAQAPRGIGQLAENTKDKPETKINLSVAKLYEATAALEESAMRLRSMLDAVLRPDIPTTRNGLKNLIDAITDRVHGTRSILNDVMQRLEV